MPKIMPHVDNRIIIISANGGSGVEGKMGDLHFSTKISGKPQPPDRHLSGPNGATHHVIELYLVLCS
jgi:hypothetical protein